MRHLLTADAARALERSGVSAGVTLESMMERAGGAVAGVVSARYPRGRVVVAAGGGNNGGDGWVAARMLFEEGRDVLVVSVVDPGSLREPARSAAAASIGSNVPWSMADAVDAEQVFIGAVAIDALLGIGLKGSPDRPYAHLIHAMGLADAVIAVDLPSGVDSDTGAVPGDAVRSDVTVTFTSPKAGCLLRPGRTRCGETVVADIGTPLEEGAGLLEAAEFRDLAEWLPRPGFDEDKWTRGRVLVIGGSPGMTGAVCLAATGALRSGAGYVIAAVPRDSLAVVETKLTTPVKLALPCEPDGTLSLRSLDCALAACSRADAVVMGMGLGRSAGTIDFVKAMIEQVSLPMVIDGDGLGALGDDLSMIADRSAPTVLTPHMREAARLLGTDVGVIAADRVGAVRRLAVGSAVALLKGPDTLISQGGRILVNGTGGPGLASLGTGDVLSGIVGALLAQGLDPLRAAALAAHLHGAAGDAAEAVLTPVCCTAEDVIACLPEAFRPLLIAGDASTTRRNR